MWGKPACFTTGYHLQLIIPSKMSLHIRAKDEDQNWLIVTFDPSANMVLRCHYLAQKHCGKALEKWKCILLSDTSLTSGYKRVWILDWSIWNLRLLRYLSPKWRTGQYFSLRTIPLNVMTHVASSNWEQVVEAKLIIFLKWNIKDQVFPFCS